MLVNAKSLELQKREIALSWNVQIDVVSIDLYAAWISHFSRLFPSRASRDMEYVRLNDARSDSGFGSLLQSARVL